jgi:alkaline phosphatase
VALVAAAAGGLLLSGAFHAIGERYDVGGTVDGLLHLTPAAIVAGLFVLIARRSGRTPRAHGVVAVLVVAGAVPELLTTVRDTAAHGHDHGLAHLLHAAPPVLALLCPAVLAAIGISWIVALAGRSGASGSRVVVGVDVAPTHGRPVGCSAARPSRFGRSAGRAPPRTSAAWRAPSPAPAVRRERPADATKGAAREARGARSSDRPTRSHRAVDASARAVERLSAHPISSKATSRRRRSSGRDGRRTPPPDGGDGPCPRAPPHDAATHRLPRSTTPRRETLMQLPKLPKSRGAVVATAAAAVALAGGATALAVVPSGDGDHSATLAAQIDPKKPKNVILLIGDGTDEAIITAARNYEKGADGEFAGIDNLPFVGDMTTHGLKTAPDGSRYPFAYVSDSAPTASGWSTGKKTVDGRLSQGPSSAANVPGTDYETVLEKFKKDGKRVGNITTSALTDATPAAAGSHINARACQGPTDMAACTAAKKSAGGKGSVAEQLVDNRIDVLMGGGRNRFSQATDAGPTALEYAKTTRGYRDIGTKAQMDAVTSLADGPVLGLFSGGTDPAVTTTENMTPYYEPLVATAAGAGSATQKCTVAARGTQPRLGDMTQKAIDLLKQDNDKGFFLQVESAMVDKQEHASDACGAIGDIAELDRSVQIAMEFQKANPDTLIIVTGDHSHSTQIVGGTSGGKATATVQTIDGDPMTIGYSTANPGSSQGHTGSQIRVAAKGPQAANVNGFIDQTDLFAIMLGKTPSTLPAGPTQTITTPATTVTVPGPTTTVAGPTTTVPGPAPTVKLAAGVAAPSTITNAAARKGIPVSLLATKAATAKVTLKSGSRTLSTSTVKLSANSPKAARLSGKKIARNRSTTLTVSVAVTAGSDKTTRTAQVTVTR